MRAPWPILGAVALLGACHAETPSVAQQPQAGYHAETPTMLRRVPLTIRTARAVRTFSVELAESPEEQERGLMFRTSVAADAGMLFPMAPARPASFWMKNTLIPLDMIFVRADGTIARIAANTVPQSLALVESGEPVVAVLELAGGEAARQGIVAGDRVRWPGGPTG